MEIERKFLINDTNIINEIIKKYNKNKKEIIQEYLYIDNYTIVRKRKITCESNIKYTYTVKTMKIGYSMNEFEKEITKDEYNKLLVNKQYNALTKDRYIIPYNNDNNGLKIELDVFHGIYEGIVFAEIEFKSEKQAKTIKLPEWFGKDITNTITNSQMAIKNIKDEILR